MIHLVTQYEQGALSEKLFQVRNGSISAERLARRQTQFAGGLLNLDLLLGFDTLAGTSMHDFTGFPELAFRMNSCATLQKESSTFCVWPVFSFSIFLTFLQHTLLLKVRLRCLSRNCNFFLNNWMERHFFLFIIRMWYKNTGEVKCPSYIVLQNPLTRHVDCRYLFLWALFLCVSRLRYLNWSPCSFIIAHLNTFMYVLQWRVPEVPFKPI